MPLDGVDLTSVRRRRPHQRASEPAVALSDIVMSIFWNIVCDS
jgi:hypothetical protein